MKTCRFLVGSIVLMLLGVLANAAVVVDCSVTQGPILHSGSGFLHGISEANPPDSLVERLNIKMLRAACESWGEQGGFRIYDRAKGFGVDHIQVVLSDDIGYRNVPGRDTPWNTYTATITSKVNRALSEGKTFAWDLWNEPDSPTFWKGTYDEFLECWRRTYNAVRGADPNAIIVGPSNSEWEKPCNQVPATRTFLQYAKANDCLPDVLTIHIWDPACVVPNIQNLRDYMASLDIDIPAIAVNEYGTGGYQTATGGAVLYFAALERARVDYGAHACWGTCGESSLDGVVNPDSWTPRAIWQAYRKYAEMSGELLQVTPGDNVDGLATYNESENTLRILLGTYWSSRGDGSLQVQLANFQPASSTVSVRVEKIGTGADNMVPQVVSQSNATVSNSSLTVNLTNFSSEDAFHITVSNADLPVAASSTPSHRAEPRAAVRNLRVYQDAYSNAIRLHVADLGTHRLTLRTVAGRTVRTLSVEGPGVVEFPEGILARGAYVVTAEGIGVMANARLVIR